MPIKGDLSKIDLANIFQMLTLNQNEGTLNIYYGGVHRAIYFTGQDLIMPFDKDTMEDRVLSLLLRQGKLSEEEVERARYNTSTLNTGLLGAIVQMRYASEEDIHAAFIAQMEEDIYELFLVKDAHFEFQESEKPSETRTLDYRYTLSPNNILMEAVRRGDEWAHIRELVPSKIEVFEIVDPTLPEGVDDPNGEFALIFRAMDGVRSIKRICEETRLHNFTVFKSCSILVDAGKIVPVDFQQLVTRADECIEASRIWDAIDLYERAIDAGIDDIAVYERAGHAYKYVSEHQKAIVHFYKLCEQCEAKGALKQAIKNYQLIRELMPTEIVARERIFQLYLNNQEIFEDQEYNPVDEGATLALILRELGRQEDALDVIQLLFTAYSEYPEVLEQLAKLSLDIQSSAMALNILEHLGDKLLMDRDSENALRIFRRIKCIDPDHRGIDDKLDRLIEDDLVRRKKRGRVMRTTILVTTFIGIFVGYFLFNSAAFQAYSQIDHGSLLASTDFDYSRDVYNKFCAKFPLSIYWFLAKERLSSIDGAEKRWLAAEAVREEYDDQESAASQQNAVNLYTDAINALQTSDLERGLRLLRKASDAATDHAWLEENEVNEKVESLERYFNEAESLQEDSASLCEAGKFAEAHAKVVDLVTNYGHTEFARKAKLPLLVKSNPTGARVLLNGEEAMAAGEDRKALTPALLKVSPSLALEIAVEKEGFMSENRLVDPFKSYELNFELRFRSEQGYDVGDNLAYAPVQAGSRFFLGYRDGRLKLYCTEKRDYIWTRTIKELQSLDAPLSAAGDSGYYCWGGGMLSGINLEDGEPLWEKKLPSTTNFPVLESYGAVFVAMQDGRLLLLNPKDGKTILNTDLRSRPVAQPIAWKKGAVMALEDGRIVWVDGKKGRIAEQRRILTTPTSVYSDGQSLIVGNTKGGIDCFGLDSAEAIYTFSTGQRMPVTQLTSRGSRVYAALEGKKVVSIDTSKLQVTGEFTADNSTLWLSPPGGNASIVVGGSNSIMYLLRSSDLSVIRKYRAGAKIEYPGINLGKYVYFYSRDGLLNGLRY
jgi:tetratricopeptide (TPR) repeat protein